MIKYFMKQFTSNKSFLLSVGVLYLFYLIICWGDLGRGMDAFMLLQYSTEVGISILLRPVAAALPISFYLMHEWGSKYHQIILNRTSCLKYAVAKTCSAYLAGFLVIFLVEVLVVLTIAIVSPGQILSVADYNDSYVFGKVIRLGHPYLAMLLYMIMIALAGSIWSVVITGLSTFTTNAYILVAAPFLLERTLSYCIRLDWKSHEFLMLFDTSSSYAMRVPYGSFILFGYSIFLSACTCVLILCAIKRRRLHG